LAKEKFIFMKRTYLSLFTCAALLFASCSSSNKESATITTDNAAAVSDAGQKDVNDNESQPNVVKVAVNSADHSTLVKAVQAADLVNALSNNGPFTVFAPNNAAFDALPAGTLDELVKPENKSQLQDILYHNVQVAVYKLENLSDGQVINMFDGTPETIHIVDGKYKIGDANIVGSVTASNGIVHVTDKVLLPPSK
jgi:uncharacterized surface protein with fasciclin (FAS1) repeats